MAERTFTEKEVKHLLEQSWQSGYYWNGYTYDSAWAEEKSSECANDLLSIADIILGTGELSLEAYDGH